MCHSDGAGRGGGGRLTLDGGLVLVAVLVHRCYLRDEEEERGVRRDPRFF